MRDLPERALTLWQPWAWLVAAGHKPIENRPPGFSFKSFRGDFWIHAGAEPNDKAFQESWRQAHDLAKQIIGADFRFPCHGELSFGAIIGRATITGIIPPHHPLEQRVQGDLCITPVREVVPWHFPEQYGFKVEHAELLAKPVPCRGFQGFWRVPAPVLERLREAA